MGYRAPITLMFHSQPHAIRCKVEFLAAYYYNFKAAFQVLVGGLLSILAAPSCAIPVMFQILGRSLIVPPAWFSGLLESWSQSDPLFRAFGVMPTFPGIMHLLVSMGEFYCQVCPSTHIFLNVFPQRHSDVNGTSMLAPFIQTSQVLTVRNA